MRRTLWDFQPPTDWPLAPELLQFGQPLYGFGAEPGDGCASLTLNSATASDDLGGRVLAFAGAGTGAVAVADAWASSSSYTLLAVVQVDNSGSNEALLDQDLGGARVFQAKRDSGNGFGVAAFNTSGGIFPVFTSQALPQGRPVAVAAVFDGTAVAVFHEEGEASGTIASGTPASFGGTLGLCSSWAGTAYLQNNGLNGSISFWCVVPGAMPLDWAREFVRDPWAKALQHLRQFRFGMASGASTITLTASLNAAVQDTRTATLGLNAAVQAAATAQATINAAVQDTLTATASLQAAVQATPTATAAADAAVQAAQAATAALNAYVQDGSNLSAALDAAVQATPTATTSLGAAISQALTTGAAADAAVQAALAATTALDAYVQDGSTRSVSLDSAVQAAAAATASLQAAVQATAAATATLSAAVATQAALAAAMDGAITAARTGTLGLSAYIYVNEPPLAEPIFSRTAYPVRQRRIGSGSPPS